MNSKFILDLVIIISISGILFLVAKTLPKIDDKDVSTSEFEVPWMLIYLERIDEKLRSGTEKLLRRFRIAILRLDNSVSKKIDNYKKDTDNKKDILEIKEED